MVNSCVNKVFLIGNVGSLPEVKYIFNGILLSKFNLATNITYKSKEKGKDIIYTEWHKIVAFNKIAEFIREFVKKGSKVFVEGYIKTFTWNDKNNIKKTNINIVVQNLCLLNNSKNFLEATNIKIKDKSIPF